jgi:hypothetical protein
MYSVGAGFEYQTKLPIIFSGSVAQRGLWPRSRGFLITHNNAPQSVNYGWIKVTVMIIELLQSDTCLSLWSTDLCVRKD